MPSAAVRRLSPLQWAGVGLGGCAVLLALLGMLAPASAFFFPLLSLWASVGLFVLALSRIHIEMCIRDRLMRAYERLLKYAKVYTTSDPESGTHPSAAREFDLAHLLVEELKSIGIEDAFVDEHCYRCV